MSVHDEIGDLSGGQFHLWDSERSEAIAGAFDPGTKRSGITLERNLAGLPQEVIAAEIARQVLTDKELEFGTDTFHIATITSRNIVENFFEKKNEDEKWFIGYFGKGQDVVPTISALGWLHQSLAAGVTPADLVEWGIEPFTVAQLVWWQAKPGETRLSQHVRALRNGWGLRYLAAAIRDNYGNLTRMIDRGKVPDWFLEDFADDIADVRELLDFFRDQSRADEKNHEPIQELPEERKAEWAKAFDNHGLQTISPDNRGRWAMYPAQALAKGTLREPLNSIARYWEQIGHKPADWGVTLTEEWFVRVGDK